MLYAPIGSISTGTLKVEDLAWAFTVTLNSLAKRDMDDPERKARTNQVAAAALDILSTDGMSPADESELATFVNETAPEMFEAYCAPFTSFGAHAGDGSDFGFWPDIDGLMEAAAANDGVLKVDAGDEWPELSEDIHLVVEVNDHGNVSLYDAHSREELWSCV